MKIRPLGDAALYVDLEAPPAARADRTLAAAAALRALLPGSDVVAGAGTLAVVSIGAFDDIVPLIETALGALADGPPPLPAGQAVVLDVVYDGPDLDAVAQALGVATHEVIALHAGGHYRAEIVGFLPGFAYLGPVDPRLALPRRSAPRPRVEQGSVAVAAGYTGVYPSASPGGWHLLGRVVGETLFDPSRPRPALLSLGQQVRFRPVADATPAPPRPSPAPPVPPALRIRTAPACATVQDRGRAGRLGEGLPPAGPLDPQAHAAANLAVGNEPGEAAIEIPLGALELEAIAPLVVSVDGDPATTLAPGDRLRVASGARAVRYLAIEGGVDVPLSAHARSTMVSGRFGGHLGRPLRRGDVLGVADRATGRRITQGAIEAPAGSPVALVIVPGPHLERFAEGALDTLLSSTFEVTSLYDRVGVRLSGPAVVCIQGATGLPCPMVRGAIEVTPDGGLIVLGPEHPTTGGYPVIGVLSRGSQALLSRVAPGGKVRFVVG